MPAIISMVSTRRLHNFGYTSGKATVASSAKFRVNSSAFRELGGEIELTEKRSSKLGHRRSRLVERGRRHVILDQLRKRRDQVEVRSYPGLDAVVLDLDNDRLPRG